MTMGSSIPRATYRLQFHADFPFAAAEAVVPYLASLGISHVYASPILTARRGSTHGYDVVDPTRVNDELGGEQDLRALAGALHDHGLGLIVDIVPNHMGVAGMENPWWTDVLRHGRSSRFASFFDIDWETGQPGLKDRILLPLLGAPYGEALKDGTLALSQTDDGQWTVVCHDLRLPIRPEDQRDLNNAAASDVRNDFDYRTEDGRQRLHAILDSQHYRLAWWRTAGDMINWRRFFDINELATLRAERADVFDATHATVLRLYAEGVIDGFRIDHVDGLADPPAYCRRLRQQLDLLAPRRPPDRQGRAWLVVEKIVAGDERLDPAWETDGTTGYDAMNELSRVLHDGLGLAKLVADWRARTGQSDITTLEAQARRDIIDRSFTGALDALVGVFSRLARSQLDDRDLAPAALRRATIAILARFPRYRSYAASADNPSGTEALAEAIARARVDVLPGDRVHLARIASWLQPAEPWAPDADLRRLAVRRFEQLSAPLAAKAVEDTLFYRFGALLSRNDVGFDPREEPLDPASWHAAMAERAARQPSAMLASATHDHKRGEDVRARLAVLSEMPDRWIALLDIALPRLAAWRYDASVPPVEPADDIMLLQTIVGAWPDDAATAGGATFVERVAGWQRKALREAKQRSSWDAPDEAYEAAARATLETIVRGDALEDLRRRVVDLVAAMAPAARINSLVQTVLKLTMPGMPDIYQGCEWRDLSLVDPDNRRPVDYAGRAVALADPSRADPGDAEKQALIACLLRLRAKHPALFASGSYRAVAVSGPEAERVIAFAREHEDESLIVAVPQRCASLTTPAGLAPDAFGETHLVLDRDGPWRNVTEPAHGLQFGTAGTSPSMASFLGRLPVVVLTNTRP